MRALVTAGGGAFCAFQAGAFRELADAGERFEIFAGTSGGALNAAFLAQFPTHMQQAGARHLEQLWLSMRPKHVFKPWGWPPLRNTIMAATKKTSLFTSAPLKRLLYSAITPQHLKDSGNRLRVPSVDVTGDEVHVGTEQDDDIIDWVLASAAFPGVLPPYDTLDGLWADGGIRDNTPVGQAIVAGATEIVVLLTGPDPRRAPRREPPGNVLEMLMRSVELMLGELERADLAILEHRNALADAGVEGHAFIPCTVIRPQAEFLKHPFDFDPEGLRLTVAHGSEMARATLEKP